MINETNVKLFCKDDISLIENYDKAISDKEEVWHCHHRRETIYTRNGLIEIGEYFNRPAMELIFLTPHQHMNTYHIGKEYGWYTSAKKHIGMKYQVSEVGKKVHQKQGRKLGRTRIGIKLSEEHRQKIRQAKLGINNPMFGKSPWNKGKHISEETKNKLRMSHIGKPPSETTKKKMLESIVGTHWWNNGERCVRTKECPGEDWVRGRM